MTDEEIKVKALELALNRQNLTTISTFQCVSVCERYLKGEDPLLLDTIVRKWGDEEKERQRMVKEINDRIENQDHLIKKWDKEKHRERSLFEKVFG